MARRIRATMVSIEQAQATCQKWGRWLRSVSGQIGQSKLTPSNSSSPNASSDAPLSYPDPRIDRGTRGHHGPRGPGLIRGLRGGTEPADARCRTRSRGDARSGSGGCNWLPGRSDDWRCRRWSSCDPCVLAAATEDQVRPGCRLAPTLEVVCSLGVLLSPAAGHPYVTSHET